MNNANPYATTLKTYLLINCKTMIANIYNPKWVGDWTAVWKPIQCSAVPILVHSHCFEHGRTVGHLQRSNCLRLAFVLLAPQHRSRAETEQYRRYSPATINSQAATSSIVEAWFKSSSWYLPLFNQMFFRQSFDLDRHWRGVILASCGDKRFKEKLASDCAALGPCWRNNSRMTNATLARRSWKLNL